MTSVAIIRNEFLNNLWLPLLREGGAQLYPKRKNKKMKMLVFTDESGYDEILAIINAKLTNENNIFAWTDTLSKAARLETYRPIKVVGCSRFVDSPSDNVATLSFLFPFEIMNVDFSRQDTQDEPQRLEREVNCIEEILKAQRERISTSGFILIYTTFLGVHALCASGIKQSSDSIHVDNWNGLNTNNLPSTAISDDDKMRVVESLLIQLSQKHKLVVSLRNKLSNSDTNGKRLYSVGGIFKAV